MTPKVKKFLKTQKSKYKDYKMFEHRERIEANVGDTVLVTSFWDKWVHVWTVVRVTPTMLVCDSGDAKGRRFRKSDGHDVGDTEFSSPTVMGVKKGRANA